VNAYRGRESLSGGASVLGIRARQDHDELIADTPDEIILPGGVAYDLGDGSDG